MADTARIRIKVGHIEIEYEGDAAFLKKDLLATLKDVLELYKKIPATKQQGGGDGSGQESVTASGAEFDHSTDTIARLLKVDSGTGLVMAAAAHLHFVKGKQKFTRQELTAEMRTAPSYFNKSYIGNLTKYLARLKSQDRLRLVGDETYALSSKEKQELEKKLAEA